jgi:hypothetical protein
MIFIQDAFSWKDEASIFVSILIISFAVHMHTV